MDRRFTGIKQGRGHQILFQSDSHQDIRLPFKEPLMEMGWEVASPSEQNKSCRFSILIVKLSRPMAGGHLG